MTQDQEELDVVMIGIRREDVLAMAEKLGLSSVNEVVHRALARLYLELFEGEEPPA